MRPFSMRSARTSSTSTIHILPPSSIRARPLLRRSLHWRSSEGCPGQICFMLSCSVSRSNAVSAMRFLPITTPAAGTSRQAAGCLGLRLRARSSKKMGHALGIAAAQSGSITENLATGAKNIGVGNAARGGLLSALAAEAGVSAAERAIEGPQGWSQATGDQLKTDVLFADLGRSWEMAKNTYKPYPCGIVLHPVIDACLDLRRRFALAAPDIASVTVTGHPLLLARADRPVNNARDAKISIHHSVAVVFLFGAAGLPEYSETAAIDPAVVALRERVQAQADPAVGGR